MAKTWSQNKSNGTNKAEPSEDLDLTRKKEEIDSEITEQNIDVSTIENDGITVRSGSKVLKLEVTETREHDDIEEQIRQEMREKVNERLAVIRDKVNEKIQEVVQLAEHVKKDYVKAKQKYEKKMNELEQMPEVTLEDAKKGLSVIKGDEPNSYYWLVVGSFAPLALRDTTGTEWAINKQKKQELFTPVIYLVKTKKDKITNLQVRTLYQLEPFWHYHKMGSGSDCWGDFSERIGGTWNTPSDILRLAKDAEKTLRTINETSLAQHNPKGLPRIDEIKENLNKSKKPEDVDEWSTDKRKKKSKVGRSPSSNLTWGSSSSTNEDDPF